MDGRGIVAVKSVTVDGPKGTSGTIDISDVTVTPKSDTSAFKGWSESDGGDVISGNTITVTATGKKLYAVVVNAHWLHFYENVGEDSDSDATYTGPVFVAETDVRSARKPADPTRKGYTFGGWYTDEECTVEFDWTATGLDEDTDLYAKWIPGNADLKVIIWKQKVTDAKDAADSAKTYDFEASADYTGTTGESIDLTQFSMYTELDYEGFHYNRMEAVPKKVKADGTTVVNVYYDRDLMTINFYSGSSHYEYVEATDNWDTQYGVVDDEYVQLSYDYWNDKWSYTAGQGTYSGTYYNQTRDNNGTQYGLVDGQMVQLTRSGRAWYANGEIYYGDRYKTGESDWGTTYGIVDGELIPLDYDYWSGEYTYTITQEYTGKRYKISSVQDITTYTGLYGSSLAANGYTWPSDETWYENPNSGGTRLTFLDAFKFAGLSGVSTDGTVLNQYAGNSAGSNVIRFYKQDLEGNYPNADAATNTVYSSGNSSFTVTEKYEGFKATTYRNGGSGAWNSVSAGSSVSASNLHIRFERQKYTLTFMSDGAEVGKKEGIPYEQVLSGYKISDPTKAHYDFKGWYEDISLQQELDWSSTMPAANKVVYAKWEPKQYHVSLDPNGGEFQNAQVGEFNVPLDTILDKTSLTQNVVKAKHELVGWFDKTTGEAYGYGKIEDNVNLIAKWRYPGQVSIVYDGGEGLDEGGEVPTDNYKYATDSSVVLGAPPTKIKEGYSFVGWQVGGTVYYTNNTFDITEEIIENYDETTKIGTVTAKAIYNKADVGTFQKTHISWYRNDGTAAFHTDKIAEGETESSLLVNEPVTIQPALTREGYTFLGWARVEEQTDEDGNPIEPDLTQDLDKDDLFLAYDGTAYTGQTKDGKTVTATLVAGDEDRVYHAMFAVWEKLPDVVVDTGDAETKFATKTVTGTGFTTAQTFNFTIAPVGTAPVPKNGETPVTTGTVTMDEAGSQAIDFGKITFTEVGEYSYTVTETGTAPENWTFDTAAKTVKVTVTKNAETGALEASVAPVTITNAYTKPAEIDTTDVDGKGTAFATKTVTGTGFAEQAFNFTIAPVGTAPAPVNADGEVVEAATVEATAADSFAIDFGKITFTAEGEYSYTVKETGTAPENWTFDTAAKTVKVTVTKNTETGALEASVAPVTITNAYTKPAEIDTTDVDGKGTAFATKTVTGTGFAEQAFNFTIAPVGNAPAPVKDDAPVTTGSVTMSAAGSQAIDFGKITFTEVGEYSYKVTETGTAPENWTFDSAAKTVTVNVTKNATTGALEASVTPATITNTYTEPEPTEIDTTDIDGQGTPLVTKTVVGEDFEPTTFNFSLEPVGTAPTPEVPEGTVAGEVNVSRADSYSVNFGTITFTKAGTYKYTAKEIIPTTVPDGWKFDREPEREITVSVINDAGELKANVSGITFTNSYNTPAVTIETSDAAVGFATKFVNGTGFTAQTFNFAITPVNGAPAPMKGETAVETGTVTMNAAGSQAIDFGAITFTEVGDYTYTVRETGTAPEGWTFETATKTVMVTVSENEESGALEANVTTGATITNSYTAPTPPTPPTPDPDPTPDPGPGPGPGPVVVVPDGPAPAAPVVVPDDPTPQVEPTTPEEIDNDPTPKANTKTWALLNLILSAITVILAIVMIITFATGSKDDEDEENQDGENKKSRNGLKFLGLIPAVGTVVLFFLTEDLTAKMALTDKWTILTAVITVIGIVLTIVIKNKKKNNEEETPEA